MGKRHGAFISLENGNCIVGHYHNDQKNGVFKKYAEGGKVILRLIIKNK